MTKETLHFLAFRREPVGRQAVEKDLTVTRFGNPIVQQRQHPPVAAAPNQPSESLLESDGGLRNLIARKRIATIVANGRDARLHHRIARNGERQLIDNNAT